MKPDSLSDIYRDMLHVSHGPVARRLHRGSLRGALSRLRNVLVLTGKMVKDWLMYGRNQVLERRDCRGKIWLLIGSRNNRDSLAFLAAGLPESRYIALNKKTQALGDLTRINLHYASLFWFRLPYLLIRLWPAYGFFLFRRFDEFFTAVGQYEAACKALDQRRPLALIFTNDHVPEMRAFLWAGKSRGIPTIYIQHASVSALFPPLIFDLSLLEGQDSLEKYRLCGPVEGEIRLIGMPKFDRYLSCRNFNPQVRRIGVCGNVLDEAARLGKVLQLIRKRFPDLQCSFRAHPRDHRRFRLPEGVLLSRPEEEGILEFLCRQDLIIGGDTSTHLEAVLMNVVSIYYPFNDVLKDYYGFLRHGLVEGATDLAALEQKIEAYRLNRPDVFRRAQYFNAVVGTENDGRSGQLAIQEIEAFLEGGAREKR